jgi:SIR2-like domain
MPIPQEIVQNVKSGKCILFLGAMASAASPKGARFQYTKTPPSGGELSKRLAARCAYPGQDVTNRQRVSLYFEFGPNGSRNALVQAIREETTKFKEVGKSGKTVESDIDPSPALHMLAALPFRIVITTNYDHLFDTALHRANTIAGRPKQPILRVYDPDRAGPPEGVPLDPSEGQPILLKLHGDLHNHGSIVVTEEDYLVFIQKMSDRNQYPIHENIRARMNSWPILFIGYSHV